MEEEARSVLASAGAAGSGPPRRRVLVVDDHPKVREALRLIVQADPGLEVVGEASDGREALEAAARVRPDVVLMDTHMPGMNGVEATRRLLAEDPRIGVVGLSMSEEGYVREAMLRAGAVVFVGKNCSAETLRRAVRLACRSAAGSDRAPARAE